MAKTNLVPIVVKLYRRADGSADWPDFNHVDATLRQNMKWSHYIDAVGLSWHYDRIENLGSGHEFGRAATCVPRDFADAAIALFPSLVEQMTEAEFETFYNERAHAHEPAIHDDAEVLQALAAKQTLGIEQDQDDLDALDPDNPKSGRRRNRRKTYAALKQWQGFTVQASVSK
jgi:hypothetical protein